MSVSSSAPPQDAHSIELEPNSVVAPPLVGAVNERDEERPNDDNNDDDNNNDNNSADKNTPVPPLRSQTSLNLSLDEQLSFGWEDVRFSVLNKDGSEKVILDGISGVVRPGELCCVLGPSGAGKSTLLSFLADRLATGKREGNVYVGGRLRASQGFEHIAGFVTQEDHLTGTLTVRETLEYAAKLSIPKWVEESERQARVKTALSDLGLTSCQDVPIGTVFTKGVSGGQKRRVSIAIELLRKPSIIFMDEPTSGLDSAAAERVMQICRDVANAGHTVIATIHQPNSAIFAMMDKLLLLSTGRPVFFGPASDLVSHMEALGHECPQFTNPADFALDVLNQDFESTDEEAAEAEARVTAAVEYFRESEQPKQIAAALRELREEGRSIPPEEPSHATDFFTQFVHLTSRTWLDNLRNPGVFWVRMVMYAMLCLMIGTFFFDVGNDDADVQDIMGVLFYVAAFLVFMSVAAIPAFIAERAVFERERSNGMYRVSAYVLANTVCGIPGIFAISLVASVLVYFLVGLNSDDDAFWIFLATLFLALMVAESMMLLISACVPFYILGIALGAGVNGMFMLGAGFFVRPSAIPDYWVWNNYVAIHGWAFQAFVSNEFDGKTLTCDNPPCRFGSGEDVLRFYDMEDVDIGTNFAVLIAMAVLYRLAFYWVLFKYHTGKH